MNLTINDIINASYKLESMQSDFIDFTDGQEEERTGKNSIMAALGTRGGRVVYSGYSENDIRRDFRRTWLDAMREASRDYKNPVSEGQHIETMESFCHLLSQQFGDILDAGRMRFGVVQKGFNLYLKFLWCLGKIQCPPHCPMDSVVLRAANVSGSWTQSDSVTEYKRWVTKCRQVAEMHPRAKQALQNREIQKQCVLPYWELIAWKEGR